MTAEVADVGIKQSINGDKNTSRRQWNQASGVDDEAHYSGEVRQPYRQKHQSVAAEASRSAKTWTPMNGGVTNQPYRRGHQSAAMEAGRW